MTLRLFDELLRPSFGGGKEDTSDPILMKVLPCPNHPPVVVEAGSGSLAQLPTHQNPGLEIVYLSRGSLRWHVEKQVEPVPPGSVFFTFPWEEHGSVDEYQPGHYWHFAVLRLQRRDARRKMFTFPTSLGLPALESARIAQALCSAGQRTFPATESLAWLLPELVNEVRRNTAAFNQSAITALARLAVIELARCVEQHAPGKSGPKAILSPRIRTFLGELRNRCYEPWTLEQMAEKCGLGRTRFATLLKRATGDSPSMYLRRLRIQSAQELLRASGKSITEIAFACGFESSQHFAKVFKTFTNISATTYRIAHQSSLHL